MSSCQCLSNYCCIKYSGFPRSSPQLRCSCIWVTYWDTFCFVIREIPCAFLHDGVINLFTKAICWNIRIERHMVWNRYTSQSQFVNFSSGKLLNLMTLNWFGFTSNSCIFKMQIRSKLDFKHAYAHRIALGFLDVRQKIWGENPLGFIVEILLLKGLGTFKYKASSFLGSADTVI